MKVQVKRFIIYNSIYDSYYELRFLKEICFLELTHRLRAVNTSDKEKSDEKHESKEKVNEEMDFYTKKIHWTWILLALIVCAVLIYMKFRLVSKSFL